MSKQKIQQSLIHTHIQAGSPNKHYYRDLIRYKELFFFLVWRNIIVRYKQAVLGILWSIIRPVTTMVIFTIIFGKLAKLPSDGGAPYPILVFTALLPWQFFANAVQTSTNSIISNKQMISKIYFPRMILPLSTIMTTMVDFIIASIVLIALMIYYQFTPSWYIILLPFFLIQTILAAIGISLFTSAINVTYRDFQHIVPFALQIGLYISPIGFSSSIIPEKWRLIYSINPMAGAIDGFRWGIFGTSSSPNLTGMLISISITMILLLLGIAIFRNMERNFADKI